MGKIIYWVGKFIQWLHIEIHFVSHILIGVILVFNNFLIAKVIALFDIEHFYKKWDELWQLDYYNFLLKISQNHSTDIIYPWRIIVLEHGAFYPLAFGDLHPEVKYPSGWIHGWFNRDILLFRRLVIPKVCYTIGSSFSSECLLFRKFVIP